jgi:thiol-disulfide isomerase/thioredoxin
MKKRTLVFCLVIQVLLYKSLFAQPLIIIEQNYDQAKLLATQQEKLLLIDFYTTWCVPCKQLDKQVFRDSSISKKVAKDFIVLRYNAENDSIFQLTKKHHIAMYPSAVVLNTEQRIIRQQYGTGGPDTNMVNNYLDFLEKAKQAHPYDSFIQHLFIITFISSRFTKHNNIFVGCLFFLFQCFKMIVCRTPTPLCP